MSFHHKIFVFHNKLRLILFFKHETIEKYLLVVKNTPINKCLSTIISSKLCLLIIKDKKKNVVKISQ